jgi:hypothetical protein
MIPFPKCALVIVVAYVAYFLACSLMVGSPYEGSARDTEERCHLGLASCFLTGQGLRR